MHCLTYVHLDLLRTQYSLAVMITLPNSLAVITLALPSGSVTKRKSQRHGQGSRSPPVPPVSANRFPQPQETSSPSLKIPSKSSQAKDPKQKIPIEISQTTRNISSERSQATVPKRQIQNESSHANVSNRKTPSESFQAKAPSESSQGMWEKNVGKECGRGMWDRNVGEE